MRPLTPRAWIAMSLVTCALCSVLGALAGWRAAAVEARIAAEPVAADLTWALADDATASADVR